MKKTRIVILFLVQIYLYPALMMSQEMGLDWVDKTFHHSMEQYDLMIKSVPNNSTYPRAVYDENSRRPGQTRWVNGKNWVAGFYPGVLWNFYKYTNDTIWAERALNMCEPMLNLHFSSYEPEINCDFGFIYFTALLPAWEYTNDERYKNKLLEAADALKGRFNEDIGIADSWDFGDYRERFYVIVDHLVNLDLLLWASTTTGDTSYYHAAVTHANTSIKDQFRTDYSSYHVEYNPQTGAMLTDTTNRDKPGQDARSRRISWSLYAYTFFAKLTDNDKYLDQAQGVAHYIITHENMPDDYVPYGYLHDPSTDQPRDASAACINTSALFDLFRLPNAKPEYFDFAKQTLNNLASSEYLADIGENNNFLIMHGDGGTNEHDVALIYADYYFTQALLRYNEILEANKPFLSEIQEQSVFVNQTSSIQLSVINPEGNNVSYSLPDNVEFVELTDNLDGTATMKLTPSEDNAGIYKIGIQLTNSFLTVMDTIIINVSHQVTAVKGNPENAELLVYPNPVVENLQIETTLTGCTLQIVNQLGQIVASKQIHQQNDCIDVSQLPNGVYFIRSKDLNIPAKIFVKQ